MRNFIAFTILLIAFVISLQSAGFFAKTRDGKPYEYFKTVDAKNIPKILAGYLYSSGIGYYIYHTPNYVDDLFVYNKDFSIIEKSKPKYTAIVFADYKSDSSDSVLELFNENLDEVHKRYNENFNMLVLNGETRSYPFKYDNDAYKDLRNYCKHFCLVDPSRKTIFVFKRMSNTEVDALEAVFQQYNRLLLK